MTSMVLIKGVSDIWSAKSEFETNEQEEGIIVAEWTKDSQETECP